MTMEEQNKIQEQHFKEWLESKSLKPESVKDYLFYYGKVSLESIDDPDYINHFLTDYKNNYVVRSFLKNLFEYLGKKIDLPKITGRTKSRIPKVITEEEVLNIAEAMGNERNKLMVLISFYGGLRRGGLLKIRPCDFNWNECKDFPFLTDEALIKKYGRLRVIEKGDQEGIALIPGKLMVRIGRFIKNDLNIISNPNAMNEKMFKIGVRRWAAILDNASLKALGKKIHPHLLKHSCGTYLLKKGMDIRYIQKALRHLKISSTQIYTHVEEEDLEEEFKKRLG